MRELIRTALVQRSVEDVWALINDIASYPDFIPGCTSAQVLEAGHESIVARLGVQRGALRSHFTTRNSLSPPYRIHMQLVDGPFKSLHGDWLLTPVGAGGCQIKLHLQYEFSSPLKRALLQPLFAATADQMVRSFVRRLQAHNA